MKERVIQVGLESLPQITNMSVVPQVSNGITGLFPDMLLRIQVWTSRWEVDHIELFMRFDKFSRFSFMPGGAIPQQKNRSSGKTTGDMLKKMYGVLTIQSRQRKGNLLSTQDIQSTIEVDVIALRCHPNKGCLPNP